MSPDVTANVSAHPKTPRPKQHRHSKSAVAVPPDGGLQPNQSHQRNCRRMHERKQAPPAWQDASTTPDAFGDFDSDGNFISAPGMDGGQQGDDSPTEKGVHTGATQKNRRKRGPKKEVNLSVAKQPQPNGGAFVPLPPQAGQNQVSKPTQTPAKSTAYAGPTFHASPAASALPLPRFFSKSVPADTPGQSLQARLEQEKEHSDKSESPGQEEATPAKPAPAQPTAVGLPRPSESPLDVFFRADREEKASSLVPLLEIMFRIDRKEKAKSASSVSVNTPVSKPPAKQTQTEPAPANHWARIYGADQKRHARHGSNGSGRDMFMMELDGSNAPSVNLTPPPLGDHAGMYKAVTAPTSLYHQQSDPVPSQHAAGQSIYTSPNYGKSMPSLASPVSNGPQAGSLFYQPQSSLPPRSADSTPAPQTKSPYHYGNRNLSPLFQAARNDNVRRSSSLRQELRPEGSVELPGNQPLRHSSNSPSLANGNTDASSIARNYLQAQAQESRMPDFDYSKLASSKDAQTTSYTPTNPIPNASHYGAPAQHKAPNVKSMEDDLRRLLNLHGNQ